MHCIDSTMSEAMFFNEVARKTDCGVLVDVNNLYVNEVNLGRQARGFLKEINPRCVQQFHLGGFHNKFDFLLDAHDHKVSKPVMELYEEALKLIGTKPTLIEWDHELPAFDVLMEEYNKVLALFNQYELPRSEGNEVMYA